MENFVDNIGLAQSFFMWGSFAIIGLSIIVFAIDKWSIEGVSLTTLLAFLLLFSFPAGNETKIAPYELVLGFANTALITVMALLMVGQALFNTDALDAPTKFLAGFCGQNFTTALIVVLGTAAVLSAFLNNTPVVVMFIPVLTAIAAQRNFDASKGLMPLSYISILGGMTTMIGSSTNLLVADVANRKGVEIGFFDFTLPGIMLAGVGAVYVLFIMPRILYRRPGMADSMQAISGKQFVSQIEITKGHPLSGISSKLGMFPQLSAMTVRMVIRRDVPIMPPFEDITLLPGDTLIVLATRKALTTALSLGAAGVPGNEDDEDKEAGGPIEADFHLAEVVVAPGSRYAGRTINGANIRAREGVTVMGVQRRTRMQHKAFSQIRLEPGDTILVGGQDEAISRLRANHNLILLEWSSSAVPMRRYAWRAISIFIIAIALAATGVLPIMVASLGAVGALIAANCLNVKQAARNVDSRIFMLVAAALAGAVALERTGGALYVAGGILALFEGQSPALILSVLFLTIAVLTNFLSNNATAVLFTPIAINLAEGLGVSAEPFVVAVIFAANCSFATPIGYQTNLLVLGPGHYRFSDFILAGTPLVILIWLTYSFVGPAYYNL